MRYITIPEPIVVNSRPYDFGQFLKESVWSDPWWRAEKSGTTRIEQMMVLSAKLDDPPVGSVVSLTDAEYEAFHPLAMMQGKQITPANSITLFGFFKAVASAGTEKPSNILVRKDEDEEAEMRHHVALKESQ